jgi:hypothetical protein
MSNDTGLTEEQLRRVAEALLEVRRRIPCLPDYDFNFKDKIFKQDENKQ